MHMNYLTRTSEQQQRADKSTRSAIHRHLRMSGFIGESALFGSLEGAAQALSDVKGEAVL